MCSSRGRVVKALDLKSNGVSPRRFESCRLRINFVPPAYCPRFEFCSNFYLIGISLYSSVAEHWSCKPGVESSILSGGIFARRFPTSSVKKKKKKRMVAKILRRPGIEPGSQEWESCMIPLHQRRIFLTCNGSSYLF